MSITAGRRDSGNSPRLAFNNVPSTQIVNFAKCYLRFEVAICIPCRRWKGGGVGNQSSIGRGEGRGRGRGPTPTSRHGTEAGRKRDVLEGDVPADDSGPIQAAAVPVRGGGPAAVPRPVPWTVPPGSAPVGAEAGGTQTPAQLHRPHRHGHPQLSGVQARPLRYLPVHTRSLSLFQDERTWVEELDQAQPLPQRLLCQGRKECQREGPLLGDSSSQRRGLQEGRLQEEESSEEGETPHGPGSGRRRSRLPQPAASASSRPRGPQLARPQEEEAVRRGLLAGPRPRRRVALAVPHPQPPPDGQVLPTGLSAGVLSPKGLSSFLFGGHHPLSARSSSFIASYCFLSLQYESTVNSSKIHSLLP